MRLVLDRLVAGAGDFRLTADLTVRGGARVALLGPSGAGKSTLLAAIAGLSAPRSGRILWDGRDIAALPPGDRPLTILFQDGNLFPHLTALRNVALGLRPDGRMPPDIARRAEEGLARVGLAGLGGRLPRDLSGGQQSRAALARALLRARPLLLLDEPFDALGPGLKAQMLDLVGDILGETDATLLLVTHDPEDARRLCPETIAVTAGQAAPPVATAGLLADPPAALAAYLGHYTKLQ
ncbi:MAG: ATP-binding cassette domain-containing protein [Rhodobacteraceae bacterium]|jgi:thiamine transport system ATP-binding protein|nr:ATP-binding cassette domain-containing protein [Paracoccaceae bacterium]